jgi:spore germination protein YaaH
MSTPLRRVPKTGDKGPLVAILVLALLVLLYFSPGFIRGNLNPGGQPQIYYRGNLFKESALYREGQVYLPFTFFKEHIDPSIQWDEKGKYVIITTTKNVYHFPLGKLEGMLNLEPYTFTYPVINVNGEIYLPADPIQNYYDLEIKNWEDEKIVSIHDLKKPVQQGVVLETAKLRARPDKRSVWIGEITRDTQAAILKEDNGWYWLETENGLMGYLEKRKVKLTEIVNREIKKEVYQPWNPLGEPIFLTWEFVNTTTVNPEKIGNLPGLQVISPTWFHLQEDGLIRNNGDKKFVDWAHQNGRQVWGLFDNSFNPELTHKMLNDTDLRIKVIKQLLSYVDLYQLDGINLDFENVYLKDKEALVQFVRELTPLLHEKERTVSIDVTFKSKSENWSLFYDRKALGEVVDYVMVMAYDEHGRSSPVAGSVASLPWVEKGLQELLKEVPNEKVLLGVPFYTRLWKEEKDETGKINLSSQALSMEQAEKWLKEHKGQIVLDEAAGQNYVEVKEGEATYKMWLEDSHSMQKRIELMKKYRLAGIAAWRRGFEKEELWPLMTELLNKRW